MREDREARIIFSYEDWTLSLGDSDRFFVAHIGCPPSEKDILGNPTHYRSHPSYPWPNTYFPKAEAWLCFFCMAPMPSHIKNMWVFTKWCLGNG